MNGPRVFRIRADLAFIGTRGVATADDEADDDCAYCVATLRVYA